MPLSIIGYGIILIFIIFLALLLHIFNFNKKNNTIEEYIMAGRNIPYVLLGPSIFVSWVWTTTILGASEAGVWYGFSGGWAYSLGAALGFVVSIYSILYLRKIMPNSVSIVEFIGERYGEVLKDIYYLICVLVVIYVTIEQAVGIGIVFNNVFQISFKTSAFISIMIAAVYTIKGGMRGVLYNDFFQFFLISILFIILSYIVYSVFDLEFIYSGLFDAKENQITNNYNPNVLSITSRTSIMYAISAVIIAIGQVLMDPGYYAKASSAKDIKTSKKSFIIGGVVVWIPVAVISAFIFGYSAIALNLDNFIGVNIANTILSEHFGFMLEIVFAVLIFSVGITTITNSMIGIQAIFTIDYYESKILNTATEAEKIKFGKIVTLSIGTLCATVAISLEGISLLMIDIFSGIFFAAPCGALILGMLSSKVNKQNATVSIILGLIFGMSTWIYDTENSFLGIVLSFTVPIIYIFISSLFTKEKFNFVRLKFYE